MVWFWTATTLASTETSPEPTRSVEERSDPSIEPIWEDWFDEIDCGPACLDPDVNGLYDIDEAGVPVVRGLVFVDGQGMGHELWASLPDFGGSNGLYAEGLTLERESFSFSEDRAHAWTVLRRWCDWIHSHSGPVWWLDRDDFSPPQSIPSSYVPPSGTSAVTFRLLQGAATSPDYYLRLQTLSGLPLPRMIYYEATPTPPASGPFDHLEAALDLAPPCATSGIDCLPINTVSPGVIYSNGKGVFRQPIDGRPTSASFCGAPPPPPYGGQ